MGSRHPPLTTGPLPALRSDPCGADGHPPGSRLMACTPASLALTLVALLTLTTATPAQDNVLLVIMDDVGVDRIGAYGEHPDPGHTPVIDQLAAEGVLFRNAWSNPLCSSSRAAVLTGRYGLRTGIGTFLNFAGGAEVALDEPAIPALLPPTYRSAAVGKWHLSESNASHLQHPLLMGFEEHRGSISNLPVAGGETAYFQWEKSVNGVLGTSTTYATTDAVDEALDLITGYGEDPWFLWLAFNAPHKPLHRPPAELHGFDLPTDLDDDKPLAVKAMIEAMDTELGRLLAGLDPDVRARTVVIVVGDNGTDADAVTAPFLPERAKGTLFEGGINVPLLISGPGVAQGAECQALVDLTDLQPTVLELAGTTSPAEDGVSLVPYLSDPTGPSLRSWVYAERFTPNASPYLLTRVRAIRDGRHKLIRYEVKQGIIREELYDLDVDPFEGTDLNLEALDAAQQQALDDLSAVIDGLEESPCTDVWCDTGLSLSGDGGPPRLLGAGSLLSGEPVLIQITDAAPLAPASMFLGLDWLAAPLKGGTFVPVPDVVLGPVVTDPQGKLRLQSTWPSNVPSGLTLYLQTWFVDVTGPFGATASNALEARVP